MWGAISKIQTITKQRKGKQNNICMDKLREISSTNDSLLLFTNQFYFGYSHILKQCSTNI